MYCSNRTRKKQKKIWTWLRERTSPQDYGIKWKGSPRHCNPNRIILDLYAALSHGARPVHLERMNNEDFLDHFLGRQTFYFAGKPSGPETLVMVDIDCHKTGTLADAERFGQYLKQHHFPDLYLEPSSR